MTYYVTFFILWFKFTVAPSSDFLKNQFCWRNIMWVLLFVPGGDDDEGRGKQQECTTSMSYDREMSPCSQDHFPLMSCESWGGSTAAAVSHTPFKVMGKPVCCSNELPSYFLGRINSAYKWFVVLENVTFFHNPNPSTLINCEDHS